jgi:hypothetical protein
VSQVPQIMRWLRLARVFDESCLGQNLATRPLSDVLVNTAFTFKPYCTGAKPLMERKSSIFKNHD